ncbi:hypothetical protein HOLleu_17760 [Holothuria leucospilota]|uniref:Calcineurin-like phosphoesterase domain-containing protein n=1 Tax=Holothuria leucospilota TaxID=206669 RepID=A0A9Q1C2L1_HOLLE|nr:hypothetical protein HOLleu_17760 [Holothuria leucospilota]
MKSTSIVNCIFIFSALLLIFYNEFFDFHTHHSKQWSSALETLPPKSENDVRILFVGDPQLQGASEHPVVMGSLMRWDADRYLEKYFGLALSAFEPNVVIFMGDLIDEGSAAGDEEYSKYAKRFKSLFSVPDHVLAIYIAGDNDLGGEEGQTITLEKVQRFENHFSPVNEILQYKHVRFYKMDFLPFLHQIPEPKLDKQLQQLLTEFNQKPKDDTIRVLLSHHPIHEIMLHRHITIMQTLHPLYAFSAHTHYSGYVVHDLQKLMKFFNNIMPSPNKGYKLDPRGNIQMEEHKIPTCNYRMGVPSTAYAIATIDGSGELHYALLWLPSRFQQLRYYFLFLMATVVFLLWKWFCRRRHR